MDQIAKLTEILGFEQNIDFAPWQNLLVYSNGCIIVIYNIKANKKTFVNYHSNPIVIVKLINEGRVLITIDQNVFCSSSVVLWDIATMKIIVQFQIDTDYRGIKPIFITQIKKDKYIVLIGNLIHILSLENLNSITCDFFTCLINDRQEYDDIYYDCKAFFNSDTFALISPNSLIFYRFDNDSDGINQYNTSSNMANIIFEMKFPFGLIKNSLRISSNVNWIGFLTQKGNCLLFDQNGNSRQGIKPLEQDMFSCCDFYSDLIIFGSVLGKIYGYNLYDSSLRFIIPSFIIYFKEQNLYNVRGHDYIKEDNRYDTQKIGARIDSMHLIDGNDLILIKSSDNSILLSQLSSLIQSALDKSNDYPILHFSFSHFGSIKSICWSINPNNPNCLYSCGNDQNLICSRYDNGNWLNSYFDIEKIFDPTQNNFTNKSANKTILNVLKCHPRYTTKLFSGDNKGYLYLFDTMDNIFQYNKEIIPNQSIESICFSLQGNLVSIGFDTGANIICDIETQCVIRMRLIEGFFSISDIENRRRNGHILSLAYFCSNYLLGDNVLVYNKGKFEIELTNLCYDNNYNVYSSIIKVITFPGEVLDFILHSSGFYLISLLDTRQIFIVNLMKGEITAGIDLQKDMSYPYSIKMDISGLYLAVVCDLINQDNNRKDSIVMYEIGTGKVKGVIRNLFMISSVEFSPNGDYLAIAGQNGCMSFWHLSRQIHDSILNVLIEMKRNRDFWYQYEISYLFSFMKRMELESKGQTSSSSRKQLDQKQKNVLLQTNQQQYNTPKYMNDEVISNIKYDKQSYNNSFAQSLKELNAKHLNNQKIQFNQGDIHKQKNRKPVGGEVLTVENIFEANLENCNTDPRRKIPFIKEEKEHDDLIGQSGKMIDHKGNHPISRIGKPKEQLGIYENRRINALKEQLLNTEENRKTDQYDRKEIIETSRKDYSISHSNQGEYDSKRKEFEGNQLQIENIKQMSLDGNKQNYYPLKMFLNDPSNFNFLKEGVQGKTNKNHKSVIHPPQEIFIEEKQDNQVVAKPKKQIMLKIEKPTKPVLPFISIDNTTNEPKMIQQSPLVSNRDNNYNIHQAINKMLSHPKEKVEEQKQEVLDLKSSQLTFGENPPKRPLTNNKNKYPEPDDIDLDFIPDYQKEIIENPELEDKNIPNEIIAKLNYSGISNSKQSITDDIDFLNDNIRNFESANKFD